MLTILATSTFDALAQKEEVKDLLDVKDSKYDALFDRLITRANGRIQRHVGESHQIVLTKYRELVPAFGGVNLKLSRYPIRDVLRVFDGSDTGSAAELTSTDYRLDKAHGWLNRDNGWAWSRQVELRDRGPAEIVVPGGEYKRYMIEYTAGYVLSKGLATDHALWSTEGDSTATGATLPTAFEDAAVELTRSMYLGRLRETGIKSEKSTYRDRWWYWQGSPYCPH